MEYNTSTSFDSFREASVFATQLAESGTAHSVVRGRYGWVVSHDKLRRAPNQVSNQSPDPSLVQELSDTRRLLDQREKEINELSIALKEAKKRLEVLETADELEVSTQVEKRVASVRKILEEEIEAYRASRAELEGKQARVANRQGQVEDRLNQLDATEAKFEALSAAFAERVWPFQFRSLKVATGSAICGLCNGDGGVNQGCPKCDGSGMVEEFDWAQEVVPVS